MEPTRLRLDEFLPYRLSYTSNLVSDRVSEQYRALFGLRIAEWRLVAVIAENDGISQQSICDRTGMDKVTVSRAAIALADRGLVERLAHPDDGRSHMLRLSRSGSVLYAKIAPKALELERRIFGGFDQDDLARFSAMLRQIDAITLALP